MPHRLLLALSLVPGVALAQTKVMCLGDSLTLGAGFGVQGGGYRFFLKQMSEQKGFAIDLVGSSTEYAGALTDREHDGHGGWTTEDLVNGRAQGNAGLWIKTFRPDVILLMIGRNDPDPLDIQAVYANYMTLLGNIFEAEPNVSVLFANVLYRRAPDSFDLQKCAIADAAILQATYVSQLAGHNVKYLDAMRVIGTNPAYFSDDVHLSDQGYRTLAALWFNRLWSKPVQPIGPGTRIFP